MSVDAVLSRIAELERLMAPATSPVATPAPAPVSDTRFANRVQRRTYGPDGGGATGYIRLG